MIAPESTPIPATTPLKAHEKQSLERGQELLAAYGELLNAAEAGSHLRVKRVLIYEGPIRGVLIQLGRSLSPGIRDTGNGRGTITVLQGDIEVVPAPSWEEDPRLARLQAVERAARDLVEAHEFVPSDDVDLTALTAALREKDSSR